VQFASEFSALLQALLYGLERLVRNEQTPLEEKKMHIPKGRNKMKYFVTGATGFVGGRVVRQLLEAGHEAVILTRNPVKASGQFGPSVRIHQGDITEKESLRKPMEGVDGVFHLAG